MFEVVVSARSGHQLWRRADIVAVSLVVHGAMLFALAKVPVRELVPPIDLNQEMATFMDVLSRMPTLPSAPEKAGKGEGGGGAAATTDRPSVPAPPSSVALDDIPLELPDIEALLQTAAEIQAISAQEFDAYEQTLGAGIGGGMAMGEDGASESGAVAPAAMSDLALAERPRVLNRFEMEKLWQRLYPPLLNYRGIPGEAVVSFIISIDGRVEPESIRMVSASHPEFIVATIAGVLKLRFRPAQLNGSPIRVRAVMPVHWRPSA